MFVENTQISIGEQSWRMGWKRRRRKREKRRKRRRRRNRKKRS